MANYRDNVCGVIRNKEGQLLVCHRTDFAPNEGWQFPQGGIDPEEDLISELKRELAEEIGTDAITVCAVARKRYTYDYPAGMKKKKKGWDGQRQAWVLCEFIDEMQAINLTVEAKPEFDDWRWVSPLEALACAVGFKKEVYLAAMTDLKLINNASDKNDSEQQ